MRWRRVATYAGLLAAWCAVALWQHEEYNRERELTQETSQRQADSVLNALVGGIRSHRRRMGPYFQSQLQATLNEVVRSEDILSVSVTSTDGEIRLTAGPVDLLNDDTMYADFRFTRQFHLAPAEPCPRCADFMHPPAGRAEDPGELVGLGLAEPGGQLDPEAPAAQAGAHCDPLSRFAVGGDFEAALVLDRAGFDAHCRRAAWARTSLTAASALVLMCLALAWRATVGATEARGRARLLESETRHLRELGQAAAGLAHETRNPLGLIRGWTQRLAQSGLDSPQQRQQARAVVEECDRVTARINQFLAFARESQPNLETVKAADVVGELAVLLEPDLDTKDLSIDQGDVDEAATVRADREMLRQALFNLLQNGVQSSPEGGTVEIAVRRGQNGHRRIEVADRGPGVSEKDVESLFLPYFTTRADGTGLGLAIVRRIATAHGWETGYSPRPGGGSIFWLDGIDG